jgi:N-acetylmuramoyl-L-alanine amidase
LPSRRGAQVFYNKNSQVSKELAINIQKNLNKLYDIKDYQALSGDYYLLKCSNYPSVIVECGFLTSPTDDELLNTEDFQDKIVFNILCGIVEYFSLDVDVGI